MNNIELRALRELLFFSAPEAALLIAASPERLTGVQERTWRRWEDGTLPVPDNIADTMRTLCDWRARAREGMNSALSALGEGNVCLVWYATLDDWASLAGREPVLWRPQCSVVAEGVAMGAQLVKFDRIAYAAWLGKRRDTEALRGAWAGLQA